MLALPRIILYGGVAVAIYLRLPEVIRKAIPVAALGVSTMSFI